MLTAHYSQEQDAIDLTDNDLSSLGNFPFFPRLHTLLLARNRINHIQPSLASSVPNLSTLILTSNNMSELADLDPLQNLQRLTHLVLMENPVTRKEVGFSTSISIHLGIAANQRCLELPLLGHLAGAQCPFPGLSESQRRRTCQG